MRLLTLARDLKRRKSRERHEMFLAEGVRSVEELLSSGVEVVGVLTAPQLDGAQRGRALRTLLAGKQIEKSEVTEAEFRSAAETESPQGVIAIGRVPSHSFEQLRGRERLRILVLDGVQDPGNVGTIIRTSAALGTDATIALPGTVDLWNPKVIRGTMGASFRHPAFHATTEELFRFTDSENVELWTADANGDDVGTLTAPKRLALAVGNEGTGLSSSLRERATRMASLPITGPVESLNVAVAAGILLYQLRH